VEQHCLRHAERQCQLQQEEHDQGDVGRSADDAKDDGCHDRPDQISHISVMGAGSAFEFIWAKSNPEHTPIIRNRLIAPWRRPPPTVETPEL
jgi:hypothetical protein